MGKELSVFIDLLRLAACLLVYLAHAGAVYQLPLPEIIGHSAREGVAVFFVLSGFVIAYTATQKEETLSAFMRARALRMYSVVPLAITLLIVCDVLGNLINPEMYDAKASPLGGGIVGIAPDFGAVFRYLTFTNELWFDRSIIRAGAPFWSLGYEVAYYVIFAMLFYLRGAWRWILAGVCIVAVGPRVAQSLPLWWLGALAWFCLDRVPKISPAVGGFVLVILAGIALFLRRSLGHWADPLFEWGNWYEILLSNGYYLILGLLLILVIWVFHGCVQGRTLWPAQMAEWIRFCAGGSFSLYIMHLPIMILIAAIWPKAIGSFWQGALASLATLLLVFGLAELGERRKKAFEMAISKLEYLLIKLRPEWSSR